MEELRYLCIDLKSFYASVECVERGLDPLTTPLVVADPERGRGTICLAVSPAMKAMGVKNRCRMFEIPRQLSFIQAPPRMKLYMEYSARVYSVYLSFVSPRDIHVYSVDEAFLDVGSYLKLYRRTAEELGRLILEAIYRRTGLHAACGVGSNLYLAKIALDITAKHSPDFVGILDQARYRDELWDHLPLTDFWQIGNRTAAHLARMGLYTMRDVAHCDEDRLYREFGVNAELLIDHAHGVETVEICHIKAYRGKSSSISSGQVLMRDYSYGEGLVVVKEMMDELCLQLCAADKRCSSVTLQVGYSHKLSLPPAKGTARVEEGANTASVWLPQIAALYGRVVERAYPVRRINICCNRLTEDVGRQLTLFDGENIHKALEVQRAVVRVKSRFGKNSLFKGMDLLSSATARERNAQIGGHRAGESEEHPKTGGDGRK